MKEWVYGMIRSSALQITNAMLRTIAEIDEFKGAWNALGRLAPERLQALRHVATIESIGSSTRIEGSQLSDAEVEALLSNIRIGTFTSRDEQEIAGYAKVMESVFESYEHMSITENTILQLHRDLMSHSEKDMRHRGRYKTAPNHVEAFDESGNSVGIVFKTATPFETPERMSELMQWLTGETESAVLHELLIIAVFIVVFLEIHPFQDGNGRLSRVLTILMLLKAGYVYVPYSSMESVIEQNKDSYYLALRRTQGTIRTDNPDWEPWVMFFLQSLQVQKQRLEKKVEQERVIIASLPSLSLQILEHIKNHGRATVAELARATSGNRNTLKGHLRNLVRAGRLTRHGAGRGSWYSL